MRKKTYQTFALLVFFSIVFQACNGKLETAESENQSDIADIIHLDLANKVYFIGPTIDSTTNFVQANCDCCASKLLFFSDSSFVCISYCMEENSYFKGTYKTKNNNLLLYYAPFEVVELNDMGFESDTTNNQTPHTTYEIRKFSPTVPTTQISMLKSRPVISFKYKGGADFGMEDNSIAIQDIVKELKQDSIWYKLELK